MFAAVLPPEPVLDAIEEFWSVRRGSGSFRWSGREQWHLTLAFYAEVPERSYDDLAERLGRAAGKRRPMTAAIAGGGAFPSAGRAKVLWAGLDVSPEDGEELRRLATGCRAAGNRAGAPPDGQRFRAHLTLARLGRPEDVTRWVRLLEVFRSPSWRVQEIALVASYLGEGARGRPRYELMQTFPLSPGEPVRGMEPETPPA